MAGPPKSTLDVFQLHLVPVLGRSGLTLRVRPTTGKGKHSVCSDYAPDFLGSFPLPPQVLMLRALPRTVSWTGGLEKTEPKFKWLGLSYSGYWKLVMTDIDKWALSALAR